MTRTVDRTIALRRLLAVVLSLAVLTGVACGSSSPANDEAPVVPTADPAVTTFLDDAQALLANVSAAGSRVAEVLERADVSSEPWRGEALSMLAALRAELARADRLPAPDSMRDTHAQLVEAAREYAAASALFSDGIRDLDLDKIEGAANALAMAVVSLANTRIALDEAGNP